MNKIQNVISAKENEGYRFMPSKAFFEKVEIGQKRFGQLFRGEKSPTVEELKKLAEFFEVPLTELIEI